MSIQDIGALGEFIGSLLILITLIYLAIQNRQQQKLMFSQAYQARSDAAVQLLRDMAIIPEFAEIMSKANRNDELSATEQYQIRIHTNAWVRNWDNTHFQYELGLIPKEHIDAVQLMIKNQSSTKRFQYHWTQSKRIYRDSFIAWVDEIIQEIEHEEEAA